MSGPAGRRGHGGRFCSTRWGLQEVLPFRDQGFRAVPGACREVKGRSSQRQHCSGISVLDVTPPHPPKPTGLSSHLINFSKPAPPQWWPQFRKGFPRHPSPCSTLSHGKPYQIPSLGAKPSLGGELGRGEARGKKEARRGLLLALALCSLASRATHPPQSHTSDDPMPFFVVAHSLTHVQFFGTPSTAARHASLSFLPLPLDHMQRHASRPSLIYPQACSALPFLFCLVNFSSFSTQP